MLYTALHIGDQLISLGGKIVNNATDAQKLIRAWPSLYVRITNIDNFHVELLLVVVLFKQLGPNDCSICDYIN